MGSIQEWSWTGLNGIRKLQNQVTQMPMHAPLWYKCAFLSSCLQLYGDPIKSTQAGGKILVYGWVASMSGYKPRMDSGWFIASLGEWGTWKTVPSKIYFSQWEEFWVMRLIIHLEWKEKWSKVKIFVNLWLEVNGLVSLLVVWNKKDWMIDNKKIWGRDMWMVMWKWSVSMKIFASYVNTHQRAYSSEEALNNWVDTMT